MMPYWCIAQTENQRETIAAWFLARADFEIYLPKIKISRGRRARSVPLFPSYIFIRIAEQWHIINKTIAVERVLLSGDHPARLRDDIVDQIRRREVGGFVKLPSSTKVLRRGQPIAIARGSFRGHVALYDGMSAHDRVRVLLELLGRQVSVELAFGDVAPEHLAG